MRYPKITVHNQSFEVEVFDMVSRQVMLDVTKHLKTYSIAKDPRSGRIIKKVSGTYYYASSDLKYFRLIYSSIKDVIKLLLYRLNIPLSKLEIIHANDYNTPKVTIKRNKKYKARDYQIKYIEAITVNHKRSHLVDLIMGYGKTFIGTTSALDLNTRFGILVKPAYIKKWIKDIKEYTNISSDEYKAIIGKKSLEELFAMSKKDRDKIKVYFISMRTMQLYIKSYLEDPDSVPIPPQEIIPKLGLHTLLNDESHQEFHALFTIVMFLDCKRLIGLSATMMSDDHAMNYMYGLLFPVDARATKLVVYKPYIDMLRIAYPLTNPRSIYCVSPRGYSHIMYEKHILTNRSFLYKYLNMVFSYIKEHYSGRAKPGQKALVFFSTIDMCTIATNYFKKRLLDLDVRRYVEDDSYDDLLEADLVVSTNLSAGTAVDIPGLITVYQTVSIGSYQANLQAAGRLRDIKGSDTRYIYFFSPQIKNQVSLLHKRERALESIAKTSRHGWFKSPVDM